VVVGAVVLVTLDEDGVAARDEEAGRRVAGEISSDRSAPWNCQLMRGSATWTRREGVAAA
jgi:hypothetical protein